MTQCVRCGEPTNYTSFGSGRFTDGEPLCPTCGGKLEMAAGEAGTILAPEEEPVCIGRGQRGRALRAAAPLANTECQHTTPLLESGVCDECAIAAGYQALKARLARNVQKVRRARGVTQAALAQTVGFHLQSMSAFERQIRTLSLERLYKIAVALNVTPGALLDEEMEIVVIEEANAFLIRTERED